MTKMPIMSRRGLLRGTAGLSSVALLSGGMTATAFEALARGRGRTEDPSYGPLRAVNDETTGLPLLRLPKGFRYASYGWTGTPMKGGTPTPSSHDGMACVLTIGHQVVLVRNHEQGSFAPSFARPEITYDPMANGGTTNLVFDAKKGDWSSSWASLSGTIRNCAGGRTPWKTWLTCEETTVGKTGSSGSQLFGRDHGYIFEVPPFGDSKPQPIVGMGRFSHEAVAIDPTTGIAYETEDNGASGFYRYRPKRYGNLAAGGVLEMAKVRNGAGQPVADLQGGVRAGTSFDVEWVEIGDPDRAHSPGTFDGRGVVNQGIAQGGTVFARLEGIWYEDRSFYFTSTSGGAARRGQVWRYEPRQDRLTLVFESPSAEVLDSPDNITVHEKRGIVLCEDGGQDIQRLHLLNFEGKIARFAENNIVLEGDLGAVGAGDYRDSEWAGATFSEDGDWLFVNIQTPGVTFAITGPWHDDDRGHKDHHHGHKDDHHGHNDDRGDRDDHDRNDRSDRDDRGGRDDRGRFGRG
jgi:secreted PhoX family phosphatase